MFFKKSSYQTHTLVFTALAVLLTSCGTVNSNTASSGIANKEAIKKDKPNYDLVSNKNFNAIEQAKDKLSKDRAAVLAMRGEHKVGFHFEETVVLQDDYERYAPKDSGGFETVVVLEDSPKHIVLQHILVSPKGGQVVKHWRQDWTYQAKNRLEFVEDQTWQLTSLPKEKVEGAWTQCVYEVSDAPRYCGTGKWKHKYGVSTWTSDRTWRPLPRREYTVREDYNALNVENRHTVTPRGWTHEQDNTKTVRHGTKTFKTIVREFGFNDYRRVDNFDFSPAYRYWTNTSSYWQKIRDTWSNRIDESGTINLKTGVDGMPIIEATFKHAADIEKGEAAPSQDEIEAIFNKWVATATH